MRILIVTNHFWPEIFRINDLAFWLAGQRHDVTVLTGVPNYPAGRFFPGYEGANDKYPDSSKATAELGWVPELGIMRVIKGAYEDYKKQKNAGVLQEEAIPEK